MNSPDQKINLYFQNGIQQFHCNFNTKGEFILYGMTENSEIIFVYSTLTNNKWMCKKIYQLPKEVELISISKHDKIWLRLNNSLCEWNFPTDTKIISKDLGGVIIKFYILY